MAYNIGDYPLPRSACYVWIAQGCICIGVPGTGPEEKGHTVRIPLDKCSVEFNDSGTRPLARQLGWQALLRLLHDRAQAAAKPRIGEAGSVTQYVLEQWMRAGNSIKSFDENGNHVATLEELGL